LAQFPSPSGPVLYPQGCLVVSTCALHTAAVSTTVSVYHCIVYCTPKHVMVYRQAFTWARCLVEHGLLLEVPVGSGLHGFALGPKRHFIFPSWVDQLEIRVHVANMRGPSGVSVCVCVCLPARCCCLHHCVLVYPPLPAALLIFHSYLCADPMSFHPPIDPPLGALRTPQCKPLGTCLPSLP
jgi:hypothetical protein